MASTKANTKTTPKELDINLSEMRNTVVAELIVSMRASFKKLDDIDVLERVLNGDNVPRLDATLDVSRLDPFAAPPMKTTGVKRRPYRKRARRTRTTPEGMRALGEALLDTIEKQPGIESADLVARVKELGAMNPTIKHSAGAIAKALRHVDPNGKLVKIAKRGGPGESNRYFLKGARPLPQAPVGKAAPGHRNGRVVQLRQFLKDQLIAHKKAITSLALTELARNQGFSASKGDRLSNAVARELRNLASRHEVRRHNDGEHVAYTIVRPSVSVTKDA